MTPEVGLLLCAMAFTCGWTLGDARRWLTVMSLHDRIDDLEEENVELREDGETAWQLVTKVAVNAAGLKRELAEIKADAA
jgi:hypothetical protein